MFNTFTLKDITEEDRGKYKYYEESAILGIKMIKAIDSDTLTNLIEDEVLFEELCKLVGNNTNPDWVTSRIADELYDRGVIDHEQFDRLVE